MKKATILLLVVLAFPTALAGTAWSAMAGDVLPAFAAFIAGS